MGVMQVDLARSDAGLSLGETVCNFGDCCFFSFDGVPEWTVSGEDGGWSDDLEWQALHFDF